MDVQITAFVFFIFRSVEELEGGGGGGGGAYYQIPSNVVLQLYSFDSGYSLVVFGKDILSGGGERGSDNTFFFKISFHYFTTIKIINTLVYQSLNSYFFCFLKYESFSNCEQSYHKNIGYLNYTYENLTFHLQTEKYVID